MWDSFSLSKETRERGLELYGEMNKEYLGERSSEKTFTEKAKRERGRLVGQESVEVLFVRGRVRDSVTRLGNFWKILVANFLTKEAQMFGDSLCYFEKLKIQVKTVLVLFVLLWKIVATFYFSILSHWWENEIEIDKGTEKEKQDLRWKMREQRYKELNRDNEKVR